MLTSTENTEQDGDEHNDEEAQNHPEEDRADADEESPLLHNLKRQSKHEALSRKLKRWGVKAIYIFPRRVKQNAPPPFNTPMANIAITCTIVGAVLGLVPQLHKAFFNSYEDGGIFNAWLTSSIKNLGKLFTTLQIFIVGCELGVSFEKMKGGSESEDGRGGRDEGDGESSESSNPGIKAILTIFLIRLVIWPAYVYSALPTYLNSMECPC
jgi:hypothetical protein